MEYVLKTSDTIDTSTVEAGRTFATFHEARATQIDSVIILGKTTKNPDNIYRQAHFACEKQEKYIRKNDAYTMKRIGCPFVISINYCKRNKEFAITRSCLEHNHEVCSDATKFSTVKAFVYTSTSLVFFALNSNKIRESISTTFLQEQHADFKKGEMHCQYINLILLPNWVYRGNKHLKLCPMVPKPPKLVNIVQGKGLPLGQIPSVDRAIDKHKPSDETGKSIGSCTW
ncbi:hypothetical protein C2G38_2042182 [Gigaspora rosea]|uniref:FAR1 domain-containing protein n=1 Tax=Gigaspora rosea TaxID=44941 RepID=A0A397UXP8_9GLOM|nr:hypothetical protein C2G38_2042182 [Gigaspora rosea]